MKQPGISVTLHVVMKRVLVSILLIISLVGAVPARAEEALPGTLENAGIVVATESPQASAEALLQLPDVYAMPGTFTYWLKQIIDQIQLIFTSDPEDRTNLLLAFSRDRLSEGYEANINWIWSIICLSQ